MGGQKLKKRKYVILGLLHNFKAKIIELIDHIFLFGESQGNLIDQTSLYVLCKNHIEKKLSPGHAALKKMSNYVTIVLILCKKFFSETYIWTFHCVEVGFEILSTCTIFPKAGTQLFPRYFQPLTQITKPKPNLKDFKIPNAKKMPFVIYNCSRPLHEKVYMAPPWKPKLTGEKCPIRQSNSTNKVMIQSKSCLTPPKSINKRTIDIYPSCL